MKKFQFGLRPVLEHRKRVEEEKLQIFAQCQREFQAAEEELERLNGEFKSHSSTLREEHRTLATEELRWHYAHLEYLDRRITMQHAAVSERRSEMERARGILLEASKERKAIEKLKTRKLEEFRLLQAAAEQRELDDANSRRTAFLP